MTVPLKIEASDMSDTAGVRADVLYGNSRFQARLWELAPQAQVKAYPISGSSGSRSLAILPGLFLDGQPLVPGRESIMDAGSAAVSLENKGKMPTLVLELCQSEAFQPVPLSEVTEVRPWGSFTVLKDEPQYKLKQLMVKPDSRLSLQRHQKREEHWFIIQGHPEITLDDQLLRCRPGDYIHIPLHSWHRIANPAGGDPVELIELQLGAYFGEDDIERREDDYGRC